MDVKCPLCGYRFNSDDAHSLCASCPINHGCDKICCPNCHYSWLVSSSLIGGLLGRKRKEHN